MDCPVCREPMIALELAEVEIDHCLACGGIWLDSGELELLVGDPGKVGQMIDAGLRSERSKERGHKCPLCDRRMVKVVVGSSRPALVIDRCPNGEGLWFDRGELKEILDRSGLDPDSKLFGVLVDMFGLDRSQGDSR